MTPLSTEVNYRLLRVKDRHFFVVVLNWVCNPIASTVIIHMW